MDTKSHARTKQIKHLSAHTYRLLSIIYYLLFLGWALGAVLIAFSTQGHLNLGGVTSHIDDLSLDLKLIAILVISIGFYLMIRITKHCRGLMGFFIQGEIFSREAVNQARAALHSAILFYVCSIALDLYWQWVTEEWFYQRKITFSGELFIELTFFCLMYTLIWTLEIGCDLHDESEFTV